MHLIEFCHKSIPVKTFNEIFTVFINYFLEVKPTDHLCICLIVNNERNYHDTQNLRLVM